MALGVPWRILAPIGKGPARALNVVQLRGETTFKVTMALGVDLNVLGV